MEYPSFASRAKTCRGDSAAVRHRMSYGEIALRKPIARVEQDDQPRGKLWAMVLAGGNGVRLQPLTRRLYGEDRPKQYAALVGSRSLLRQTLDRVGLLIPTDRTLVVSQRHHVRYVTEEFGFTATRQCWSSRRMGAPRRGSCPRPPGAVA